MRQLKFRIWHKEFKKFLSPDEWFLDLEGKLRFFDITLAQLVIVDKSLYTIQQFTGLIDRHEKEIYEGDIIKWTEQIHNFSPYENETYIGKIIYCVESFRVKLKYTIYPLNNNSLCKVWKY
jgi:uncharacterized phage protein (TIGR01671 family)